jgi:hypothetical protein
MFDPSQATYCREKQISGLTLELDPHAEEETRGRGLRGDDRRDHPEADAEDRCRKREPRAADDGGNIVERRVGRLQGLIDQSIGVRSSCRTRPTPLFEECSALRLKR